MSKQELVKAVQTGVEGILTVAEAQLCVDAMLAEVSKALLVKGEIRMQGVGTLKVVQRPARTGRNPRTGEPLQIPARRTVQLKVSPMLLDALNK